jgi:hypothetical protein
MIACDANGTIFVILHVPVEMGHRHEGGKKEEQNEKCSKTLVPEHGAPFTIGLKLNFADKFVKT